MALWSGMSERERRLFGGGLVLAAFISTLLFVDVPLYRSGRDMERKAAAEQSRLKSIIAMGQEYLSVKDEVDEIRGKAFNGAGTSLSGIDAIVGKSGLKKKMASLKPTTTPVAEGIKAIKAEVAFERISLSDLSRLIAAMEADGHPMAIERISIKATYEDPSAFQATLIVNTVERE